MKQGKWLRRWPTGKETSGTLNRIKLSGYAGQRRSKWQQGRHPFAGSRDMAICEWWHDVIWRCPAHLGGPGGGFGW